MISKNKQLIHLIIAASLGALSIALGAFSAHTLELYVTKNILSSYHLTIFEKAVKYQMYHSIVLLLLTLFNLSQNKLIFYRSVYFILSGTILFSGSLYWMAIQNILPLPFPHSLFWITPLGGLLMIIGWISIIIDFYFYKQ